MNFTITDEPFAVGFMNCMSTCTAKCIGAGMREVAKVRPISMVPGEMLIGRMGRVKMGIDYGYDGGLWVNLDLLKKRAEENPEKAIEYMKIATFFQGKASGQHHGDACIGQEQLFYSNRTYWAGTTGHCNVDYGSVVHLGTDGVREKIAKYRPLHPEASEWYDGVEMALEGLECLGVKLHEGKNMNPSGGDDISTDDSAVRIYVVDTNEEIVVARKAKALLEM